MIPLIWFLLGWFVLLAIFAFSALLTVMMSLRYGLSGLMTYFSTVLFLGVTTLAIVATGSYLLGVDWSRSLDVVATFLPGLAP